MDPKPLTIGLGLSSGKPPAAPESGGGGMEDAARSLIAAIKAGDAKRVANLLEDCMHICMNSEPDADDEDEGY